MTFSHLAGGIVVALTLLSATGCAAPTIEQQEEESGETTSNQSAGCELLAGVAQRSFDVSMVLAGASGVCAAGTFMATVATGGVAAVGTPVCIAPLVTSGAMAVLAVLTSGAGVLLCNGRQSEVTAVESNAQAPAATRDGQTCTDDKHRELARKKGDACDMLENKCQTFLTSSSSAPLCLGLDFRRRQFEACRAARQEVIDECFGGTPTDRAHRDELQRMENQVRECDRIIASTCG